MTVTAYAEPMKLVAENLELAKQGAVSSQKASFYETNYSSMKSQVEILNQGIVKLQQDCIDLLHDVDSLRVQLETVHKIATVRAESNQRLSADLESAKTWGRLANESLGNAGLFPLPEPRWEAAGYNVLHPEDMGP